MGGVFSSQDEDEEKELEQEPEFPPYNSSSPLSPQVSMSRTPFFGPSIQNSESLGGLTPGSMTPVMLSPTHVTHPSRFQNVGNTISPSPFLPSWLLSRDEIRTEVYLIRHGESTTNLRPNIISGRSSSAVLTANGKRQAAALGAFFRNSGIQFDASYSSPLARSKQTAMCVYQEMGMPAEQLELSDSLQEMSQGHWEGRLRSEVHTKDVLQHMNTTQLDFRAPGGESQRQVEYRMVEFLNDIVLHNAAMFSQEAKFGKENGTAQSYSAMQAHTVEEIEITPANHFKHHSNVSEGNGEHYSTVDHDSRFQDHFTPGEIMELRETSLIQRGPYCVAVFTHAMAIKCVLRGLLGSDPPMTNRICIDNTSVTVLRYASSTGWQIQRVNDTAHLRFL